MFHHPGMSEQARTVVYGTVKLPSIEPLPPPKRTELWAPMPPLPVAPSNALVPAVISKESPP
jgi:hypothetical protein